MTTPRFPASRVKSVRVNLGLTQRAFAEEIGVTQGLVAHWENGIRIPSGPAAKLLYQLAAKADEKSSAKSA